MTLRNFSYPLAIVGLIYFGVGCTGAKAPAAAAPPAQKTAPVASESEEDNAILAVSKAIRKNKLTTLADECITYRFDGEQVKDAFVVDVSENHSRSSCGGDPNTAPRLFSVRVAKADGAMTTDQGSATGEFRPISK